MHTAHLNLFYQTDGFNLSLLSDEFAAEWKAQKDWLRLSFHALGEFPDKPYQKAGYEQMKKDLCLDWLLGPAFLAEHFQHWCPMVRHYFHRLLCWRMARYDGTASELDT